MLFRTFSGNAATLYKIPYEYKTNWKNNGKYSFVY